MPRLVLTSALVLSGAAALIYETIWTRQLALLMGHTVAAATCVLAAFMLGLAGGAALIGRIAVRLTPVAALRTYAAVEVLIGVLALLLPVELAWLRPILSWAYEDTGGTTFGILRFVSAVAVVTLPSLAMGATLPLVVRWAIGSAVRAGRDTGWLYASNAGGAVIGAVLSGFVLLPTLGMRRTTFIAVGLNLLATAFALLTARSPAPAAQAVRAVTNVTTGQRANRLRTAATVALAMSGAASLILQLTWTRILSLVLGPTTYAFSTMVAVFITGITVGAVAGGWLSKWSRAPAALAGSLLLAGLAAIAAAAWAQQIPLAVAGASSFTALFRMQAALVSLVMLPMTTAFGAVFPLAVALTTMDDDRIASDVARIYAANTLGAIAGALAGGYLLIPVFGLQGSVQMAATVCFGAGTLVLISRPATAKTRATTVAFAVVLTAAVWMLPPWNRGLLSSGAYKYAAYLPAENREAVLQAGELLYYGEGAASTVSVRRAAGSTTLAIDGKVDASNAGDMLTQRLLAHVPLLLHPDPRAVAIIGLGSGVTLGSALRHPVTRVDTIEISPQVIQAAAHFSAENGDALGDPRSRLIAGDGRTHLMLTRQRYDVIVSEPSNPWIAGVAGLFTHEMFRAARARLAPGGIFCQWAHVYDMSDEDLRSIVRTFLDVFPKAHVWGIGDNDILLIGADEPLEPRLDSIRRHWNRPGVAADLAGVSVISPELLLSLHSAGPSSLRMFAGTAPSQTDDRLALEFSGPRSAFGGATGNGLEALRSPGTLAHPNPRDRGLMLLRAESFVVAVGDLLEAVRADPGDRMAIDGLLRAAGPAGRMREAEELLRGLIDSPPKAEPAVGLSRILASRGDFGTAAEVLRPVIDDRSTAPLEQLASVYADAGDPRLSRVVSGLQRLAPDSNATVYFSAVLALAERQPHKAIDLLTKLRAANAAGFREFTLLGSAYAELGRRAETRQSFSAAVASSPREPTGYENLANAELDAGDFQAAVGHFAEALILDPSSSVARKGLAEALARRR